MVAPSMFPFFIPTQSCHQRQSQALLQGKKAVEAFLRRHWSTQRNTCLLSVPVSLSSLKKEESAFMVFGSTVLKILYARFILSDFIRLPEGGNCIENRNVCLICLFCGLDTGVGSASGKGVSHCVITWQRVPHGGTELRTLPLPMKPSRLSWCQTPRPHLI